MNEPSKGKSIQIVLSVPQQYPSLKDDLRKLADQSKRSLSNYVILLLADHVSGQNVENK